MKMLPLLASGLALGVLAHAGFADTFAINGQTYTTQFNTGSGPDHALMVVEYGSANYEFGFSWDAATQSPTSFDMLNAVTADSSGNMTVATQFFDFDDGTGPHPLVEAIGYLADQPVYNYPSSWFNFFTADGGSDWSASFDAVDERVLSDNSADDWVLENAGFDDEGNPPVFPTVPVAVPEPASLALLGFGCVLILRRRQSKR